MPPRLQDNGIAGCHTLRKKLDVTSRHISKFIGVHHVSNLEDKCALPKRIWCQDRVPGQRWIHDDFLRPNWDLWNTSFMIRAMIDPAFFQFLPSIRIGHNSSWLRVEKWILRFLVGSLGVWWRGRICSQHKMNRLGKFSDEFLLFWPISWRILFTVIAFFNLKWNSFKFLLEFYNILSSGILV